MAYKLLKENNSDDLLKDKKVYFVHAAKKDSALAQKIADNIFGKGEVIAFNRLDFLNHFISDFKDVDKTTDNYKYLDGTVKVDSEGNITSTQTLKVDAEVPSVIFIDEIGQFSDLDLVKLQEWAELKGIQIITAGDLDLNVFEARVENLELPSGDKLDYSVGAERNYFVSSIKLGLSMRTDNSVKTKNQNRLQDYIKNKDYLNGKSAITEYIWDGDLIFGDEFISNGNDTSDQVNEAYQKIEQLVRTLKSDDGDFITYIYDSEQSELYKKVKNSSFGKDGKLIKFMKGVNSQGDESRYAVIDLYNEYTNGDAKARAFRMLYTGMTRALQGSIIVTKGVDLNIESNKIDSMYSEKGFEEHIKNYIESRKKFLKELYGTKNKVNYIPPTQLNNQQQNNLLNQLNNQNQLQLLNNQQQLNQNLQLLTPEEELISYGYKIGDWFIMNGKPNEIIGVETGVIKYKDIDGKVGSFPMNRILTYRKINKPLYTPKVLSDSDIETKYREISQKRNFNVTINGKTIPVQIGTFIIVEPNGDTGKSSVAKDSKGRVNTIVTVAGIKIPFLIEQGQSIPILGIDSDGKFLTLSITDPILQAISLELTNTLLYNNGNPIPTMAKEDNYYNYINSDLYSNNLNSADNLLLLIGLLQNSIKFPPKPPILPKKLQDFKDKYGVEVENYRNKSNLDLESVRQIMENLILDQSILNKYPYRGFKSIDNLLNYLENPLSSIPLQNDLSEPYMFYMFYNIDNKPIIFASKNITDALNQYISDNRLNYYVEDRNNIRTKIDEKIKKDTPEEVKLDDEPIIDTDNDIDELNALPNPRKFLFDSIKPKSDKSLPWEDLMNFNIMFNSFNALELGAEVDPNDETKFVYDQLGTYTTADGRKFPRRDGVNGLKLMVDNGLITNESIKKAVDKNVRDLNESLRYLARILNIILNNKTKLEIIKKLKSLFLQKRGQLDNIDMFINFGIIRSTNKENNSFHKSPNEKSYGLDTSADESDKIEKMHLVALIGDKSKGEFLQIPLFSLSNPVTIIDSKDGSGNYTMLELKQIADYTRANLSPNPQDGSEYIQILKAVENAIANDPKLAKYKDFAKYCKVGRTNKRFVYRFGKITKDGKIQHVKSLTDEWTPLNNLTNLGLDFSLHRGMYANGNAPEYKAKPISILELINDPTERFNYSRVMQIPEHGLTLDGEQVIKPGHNFILASQDPDIKGDAALMKKYKEEKGKGPTVKRIYVFPPKATLEEYFNYLTRTIIEGTSDWNFRIGYVNTVHKILRALHNSGIGKAVILKRVPSGEINWENYEKILNLLNQAYDKYNNEKDPEKRKQYLKDYTSIFGEEYPNSKSTILNQLTTYLKYILGLPDPNNNRNIIYNGGKTDGIKDSNGNDIVVDVKKILEDLNVNIYYVTKPGNNAVDEAKYIKGDNGYTLDNKPFEIRGKLDAYQFSGKIPGFNMFAYLGLKEGGEYLNVVPAGSKLSTLNKVKDEVDNLINTLLDGTGITINSDLSALTTKEQMLSAVVRELNGRTDVPFVTYSKDGKLYKSLGRGILLTDNGDITIKDNKITLKQNGLNVTDLKLNTGNEITFLIEVSNNGNPITYDAYLITDGNIEYYPLTPPSSTIDFKLIAKDIVNQIKNNPFKDWINLFKTQDSSGMTKFSPEFRCYDRMNPLMMKIGSNIRQNKILEMLNKLNSTLPNYAETKLILELLNNLESAIQEKQNDNANCKIGIKL